MKKIANRVAHLFFDVLVAFVLAYTFLMLLVYVQDLIRIITL